MMIVAPKRKTTRLPMRCVRATEEARMSEQKERLVRAAEAAIRNERRKQAGALMDP